MKGDDGEIVGKEKKKNWKFSRYLHFRTPIESS